MASEFNANVWPPMIFPEPVYESGIAPTPPQEPFPPSVLPQPTSTTSQLTAVAPSPPTVDYQASIAAQQATLDLFKIYPPTFPTVRNS